MAKKKAATKDPLDAAVEEINGKYGDGSIMSMDDFGGDIETYSTGSMRLDEALGGGIARGRIIELFGWESSGKTTTCLSVIAQAQKLGHRAFFIDAEHALDPVWAERVGVSMSPDLFRIAQPGCGEEALQIADRLAEAGAALVVIDSVAALTPKAELDGEIGDAHVGRQARMMSQAMRKLAAVCKNNQCTMLFVNQLRHKVGGMPGFGGPQKTTPGGHALKFYASQRIDIARKGSLTEGGKVEDGGKSIGQRCIAKVTKNKVAPPFRVAEYDIMFDSGISFESELIDIAVAKKVMTKSGAWFKYGDTNVGQGKEKTRQRLIEDEALRNEIHLAIQQEKTDDTE